MIETIAVLSDSELLADHLRGLKEVDAGEVVDAETLRMLMAMRGRDVAPQ